MLLTLFGLTVVGALITGWCLSEIASLFTLNVQPNTTTRVKAAIAVIVTGALAAACVIKIVTWCII